MRHRNISSHVEDLHDGRVVEPGGFAELTVEEEKEPHNARLIEEGLLIPAPEAKAQEGGKSK